jgi:serine/threonine protein kinase
MSAANDRPEPGMMPTGAPAENTGTVDDPRVLQAVREYQSALEAGQPLQRQEFLLRHREIATALAECLDALEFVHAAAPRLDEPGHDRSPQTLPVDSTVPLGDFRILREIGRGGMGIVYEAEQLSLGRRIALKVLPFAAALDPKHLQRFQREARAAAHLHHTNIVSVYSVGCERGVYYYAMQFIEGQSLAEVIHQRRQLFGRDAQRAADPDATTPFLTPAAPDADTTVRPQAALSTIPTGAGLAFFRTVAHLGVQAAEALEHAHEQGIIHRDVKPANLLVDVRGHLWVTDFGLAQMQADGGLTMTGDVVGTLRYMSPEQAQGKSASLDQRTDIYSLGATLYELLALRPAFDAEDRHELLRQIAFSEPPPLRRHNRAVPTDLETIVLKAMAQGPEQRYASAQELAADLRRFLENKPIRARRPTLVDWAAKWSRRRWQVVVAAGVLLLLAVAGLAVSNVLIMREQARTQAALDRAESNFNRAHQVLDFFTRIGVDELADKPELRRKMLEASLAYYEDFIDQRQDDPSSQAELAATHLRLASILDLIGSKTEALASLDKAERIQEKLFRDNPNSPELQRSLSAIYSGLGWLRDGGRFQLLAQEPVQKELKLSLDQVSALAKLAEQGNEVFRASRNLSQEQRHAQVEELSAREKKALAVILEPGQARRLQQLVWQQRGFRAVADADVADALGLSDEQKQKIRALQQEAKFRRPPGRPGEFRPERGKSFEELAKNIRDVLTAEQLAKWKEMLGEPFQGVLRHGYPGGEGFIKPWNAKKP